MIILSYCQARQRGVFRANCQVGNDRKKKYLHCNIGHQCDNKAKIVTSGQTVHGPSRSLGRTLVASNFRRLSKLHRNRRGKYYFSGRETGAHEISAPGNSHRCPSRIIHICLSFPHQIMFLGIHNYVLPKLSFDTSQGLERVS